MTASPTRAAGPGGLKLTLVIAALAFVIDRIAKYVIVEVMDLKARLLIEVMPPWLSLLMAWNEGANFGLGDSMGKWFWMGLAVAISAGLMIWSLRLTTASRRICVGLLVGGALGNALDRWIYGAVADFFNMTCCGFYNPYAFNPADIFIFAGAIGLVLLGAEDPAPGAADDKPRAGR